ncbi:MAG: DUF1615 domain-containing protein [Proteobacteria bacterium]|nr:DUF1615 domain-containing protein [Pseudomonadota bacterium]
MEGGLAKKTVAGSTARLVQLWVLGMGVLLGGCASEGPATRGEAPEPAQTRDGIEALLPRNISDRAGWAGDIYTGFTLQGLEPTRRNVCAVISVIQQESNFRVDPVIPGLGAMARREIDTRAGRAGLPLLLVHGALDLESSTGRTYGERIDAARTEKDLSDVYEDFIGAVPLGKRLFSDWNPIRTRGPMQVSVSFAERYAAHRQYPYPVRESVADEVFTRRGSLYFGIAHLFAYQPPYDSYLYRFADFNAGQFASRNAAFQNAVSTATGVPLVRDGTLLLHTGGLSETELALLGIADRLGLDQREIHSALESGQSRDLQQTRLYQRVFAMAEREARRPLPRAVVPTIALHGPKISRRLTTSWYAHRVEGRYQRCLGERS